MDGGWWLVEHVNWVFTGGVGGGAGRAVAKEGAKAALGKEHERAVDACAGLLLLIESMGSDQDGSERATYRRRVRADE